MTIVDDVESFQIDVQQPLIKTVKKWVVAYGDGSSLNTVTKRQFAVQHFDLIDTGFGLNNYILEMKNPNNGYYVGNPNLKVIGYRAVNELWGPEYTP